MPTSALAGSGNDKLDFYRRATDVSKIGKIVLMLIILINVVVFIIGAYLFIVFLWGDVFSFMRPKEITTKELATYNSPDGEYLLVFEQMGDPQWSFGPTDVRLTLKDHDGTIIERVSTQLSNDGVNAGEHNIVSISWNDDAVIVVLRASEMKDKKVSIAYNKR